MDDDFARLVSRSNPAAQLNGYIDDDDGIPYGHAAPAHRLDPFFDDDDDLAESSTLGPGSSFGRSAAAMQSKESGLPLSKSAANPAGHSRITLPGSGQPQGWIFDDDDVSVKEPVERKRFSIFQAGTDHQPRSKLFQGFQMRKTWKWPWEREKVLTGERIIALNDHQKIINKEFCSNYISTSKYNAVTFIPKFLFGTSWYTCYLVS